MTEDQAKQCWCPMVRASTIALIERERDKAANVELTNAGSRCIGSACMMFRKAERDMGSAAVERVWCGLAGKP